MSLPDIAPPPGPEIARVVQSALAEDLGLAGDLTSQALIDADQPGRAEITARAAGVLAGLPYAQEVVAQLDSRLTLRPGPHDGAPLAAGDVVAEIAGPARAILAAERSVLNFLTHLSGIATLTHRYVTAVKGTRARIVDTRKTLPGLRAAQKYAVRCGGGANHRFGLFDAILIKDNHIAAIGDAGEAVRRARQHAGHLVRIEVEIDHIAQIAAVLAAGADVVLVDNLRGDDLAEAVRLVDGRALVEASGGVDLDSVAAIAEAGVDLISLGRLTHSAPALDLGLDWR